MENFIFCAVYLDLKQPCNLFNLCKSCNFLIHNLANFRKFHNICCCVFKSTLENLALLDILVKITIIIDLSTLLFLIMMTYWNKLHSKILFEIYWPNSESWEMDSPGTLAWPVQTKNFLPNKSLILT